VLPLVLEGIVMETSLAQRVYELLLSGFIQNEAADLVSNHPDYLPRPAANHARGR
jgi:hypothetical protein